MGVMMMKMQKPRTGTKSFNTEVKRNELRRARGQARQGAALQKLE